MSYETEILTEKIDKLENYIMELNQSIKKQKKHSEVEINVFVSFIELKSTK